MFPEVVALFPDFNDDEYELERQNKIIIRMKLEKLCYKSLPWRLWAWVTGKGNWYFLLDE